MRNTTVNIWTIECLESEHCARNENIFIGSKLMYGHGKLIPWQRGVKTDVSEAYNKHAFCSFVYDCHLSCSIGSVLFIKLFKDTINRRETCGCKRWFHFACTLMFWRIKSSSSCVHMYVFKRTVTNDAVERAPDNLCSKVRWYLYDCIG